MDDERNYKLITDVRAEVLDWLTGHKSHWNTFIDHSDGNDRAQAIRECATADALMANAWATYLNSLTKS